MKKLISLTFATGALFVAGYCTISAQTENSKANKSAYDDAVVAAINAGTDIAAHLDVASVHRQQTIHALLGIFDDPKADIYKRSYAAKYLGMIRADEAVDDLAANIKIGPPGSGHIDVGPDCGIAPAQFALKQIGLPSIPALVRNLAESDDFLVRRYSFDALLQIEGDKDVVQLRLQKALVAEKDVKKQARLRSELAALADNSFVDSPRLIVSADVNARLQKIQQDYGVRVDIHGHQIVVGTAGLVSVEKMNQIEKVIQEAFGNDYTNYTICNLVK